MILMKFIKMKNILYIKGNKETLEIFPRLFALAVTASVCRGFWKTLRTVLFFSLKYHPKLFS